MRILPPQASPTCQASRRRPRRPALRLARGDDVDRLGHHLALDAAARYRADEIALAVDRQLAADRLRRRAPGLDDGRERHLAALVQPAAACSQNRMVGCAILTPPQCLARRAIRRRIMRRALRPGKRARQILEAVEDCAPGGTRRHGAASPGCRPAAASKPSIAQQRVEPDDALGRASQPLHLALRAAPASSRSSPSVISSTCGALRQHAPRPVIVELLQAAPMRVPPDQSFTAAATLCHRLVDVAARELARDVGEPRAEQEDVHALAVVRQRMQEMQEHAAVIRASSPRCRTARPAAARAGCRSRRSSAIRWPPARSEPLSVRRRSMRSPWRARREAPGLHLRRWMQHSRRWRVVACACSAAVICSKSLLRSTSIARERERRIDLDAPGVSSRRLLGSPLVEQRLREPADSAPLRLLVRRPA